MLNCGGEASLPVELFEAENIAGFPALWTTGANTFYPILGGIIQRGLPYSWEPFAHGLALSGNSLLACSSCLVYMGFVVHFLLQSKKGKLFACPITSIKITLSFSFFFLIQRMKIYNIFGNATGRRGRHFVFTWT